MSIHTSCTRTVPKLYYQTNKKISWISQLLLLHSLTISSNNFFCVFKDVCSRVVMLEDDTLPICQTRTFLLHSGLQFFQLIAVNIWVNCCIRRKDFKVEDTLPIPPNWKQNLLWMKACFRDRFWRCRSPHDLFLLILLYTIHFSSPVIIFFKKKTLLRFTTNVSATNRMLKSGRLAGPLSFGAESTHRAC